MSRKALWGCVAVSVLVFAGLVAVPSAQARSSYYTNECVSCHGSSSTCAGCHVHGTRPSVGSSSTNVQGTTNKTTYAPGETVSVTINGGNRSGWVRAILYNESMVEQARSTGPSGQGGGSGFPVTLTAPAPAQGGTYRWTVAWYGNQRDPVTPGGSGWVPDRNNSGHGEERAQTNSFTVTATTPTLSSLSVSGPASVNEGSSATYAATASWSDGSTTSVSPTWSENSSFATISASGVLSTQAVTSNQTVTVSASYTSGGVTRTASQSVTIQDVPATLSGLTISGPASVNEGSSATYTATASWSDGSTTSVIPTWSENSSFATISASGVLSTQAVTSNQTVTVSASYTSGGVTRTASQSVTIQDVPATLSGLAIGSPTSVLENGSANYTATASWSDGTTSNVTAGSSWSVSPDTYASISGGVLTASSVPSDQTVTVSASYTAGGVTRTASLSVTIVDTAPPAEDPVVSEVPAAGTLDAPVNTVVTATVAPGENVEAVFNPDTFSLRRMATSAAETTSPQALSPDDPELECEEYGFVEGAISYDEARTTGIFTPACPLRQGTTYLATIAPAPGGLSEPASWEFTTVASSPDTDDDGVHDLEDDYPSDKKKGTPPSTRGKGKFLIDLSGDVGDLSDVRTIDETDVSLNQAGNPSGFEFQNGLVSYTVTGVAPGSTVTVKVTVPGGIPKGSKVYKADGTGFHEYPGAVINGSTITLTVTDGGAGDADGTANGRIVDPVGVASPVASGSGTIDLSTGASSGGGCAAAPSAGRGSAGTASLLLLALLGLVLRALRRPAGRK